MYSINRVREVRLRLGLAQQAVAVKSGVNTSALTMIEKYGYYPGPDVRRRIKDALGVTEAELWPGLGNEIRGK